MANFRVRAAVVLCAAVCGMILSSPSALADPGSSDAMGSSSGSAGSSNLYLPVPTGAGLRALAAAATQVGKPYKWGGTGPNSWDCSGLVRWAFSTTGVNLPRTSEQQAHVGHAVPLWALAPGDIIIFWHDSSHVGIYAGFNQVLNAYGPNGVPIGFNPLNQMPPIKTIRRLGW